MYVCLYVYLYIVPLTNYVMTNSCIVPHVPTSHWFESINEHETENNSTVLKCSDALSLVLELRLKEHACMFTYTPKFTLICLVPGISGRF